MGRSVVIIDPNDTAQQAIIRQQIGNLHMVIQGCRSQVAHGEAHGHDKFDSPKFAEYAYTVAVMEGCRTQILTLERLARIDCGPIVTTPPVVRHPPVPVAHPARVTHTEPGAATIQTDDGTHTVRVQTTQTPKVGDPACVIEDGEGYHEATINGHDCATLSIHHN